MKTRRYSLIFACLLACVLTTDVLAQGTSRDIHDMPPLIRLTYPDVPEAPEVQRLLGETLTLKAINNTGVPVVVEFEIRSIRGDSDVTRSLGSLPLDIREERTITFAPEGSPESRETDDFASQLLVTGRISDSSGRRLGNALAPTLFFHRERGVTLVYRELIKQGEVAPGQAHSLSAIDDPEPSVDVIGVSRPESDNQGNREQQFAVIGPSPDPSIGVGVKICINLKVNYSDINYGEDYWTTNSDKPASGIYLKIFDNKLYKKLFDGYTGDGVEGTDTDGDGDPGSGCTPWLGVQNRANWVIYMYSKSRVKDNFIWVYNDPKNETQLVWMKQVDLVEAGKNTFSIPYESRVSSALAAASNALYRHAGGMKARHYEIHTGAINDISWTGLDSVTNEFKIFLTDVGSHHKNTIAHEMGHRLLQNLLGPDFGISDVSFTDPGTLCQSDPDRHNMLSKEYGSGAFHEGFADYYAVDVWNSHSQSDGATSWWGVTYDAEGGTAWMKNVCTSPFIGFGNEWDWMRFFWDFHTDAGDYKPSFDQILDIIANAATLTNSNAYSRLVDSARSWDSGRWLDRLRTVAISNGINY